MRGLLLPLLFLCAGISSRAISIPVPAKSITIILDSTGHVYMGRDTLTNEQLTAELQKRLWKSYMGTGKMYSSIRLLYRGEVLMGAKAATKDAIQLAQKNALTEVSLHLHKKLFKDLNSRQQEKIRKQFPALFQSTYD